MLRGSLLVLALVVAPLADEPLAQQAVTPAARVGPPVVTAPTVAQQGSPGPVCDRVTEAMKTLAWPLFALGAALLFRKPIREVAGGLSTRVTRLSVFNVQLELLPAAAPAASPLLDDIRTGTTWAAVNDSSRSMLEQVQSQAPADFAEINLGTGDEWLASRLYIAAVMLDRMRGVKVFVFVERTPATARRFVAVVPVRQLRWALGRRYPWFESAFLGAYAAHMPNHPLVAAPPPALPPAAGWRLEPRSMASTAPQFAVTDTGAFEPWDGTKHHRAVHLLTTTSR